MPLNKTGIEWCRTSSNPLRARLRSGVSPWKLRDGWHCEKVSPGCLNCYAETIAKRLWTPKSSFTHHFTDQVELFVHEPSLMDIALAQPNSDIFACDMTDLFQDAVSDLQIAQILMGIRFSLSQVKVLTKRPERALNLFQRKYWHDWSKDRKAYQGMLDLVGLAESGKYPKSASANLIHRVRENYGSEFWPPKNLWLGVSVEDQKRAEERIPILKKIPAKRRFLSMEPLLERVHLTPELLEGIDWIVVGGESGPKARPCNAVWVMNTIMECRDAGVPVFVKQLGSNPDFTGWLPLPGETRPNQEAIRNHKGGEMIFWPERLRVGETIQGYQG